ncbi:MAG TPA: DNA primase [Bacillota bacterium]|nr:DNA primase [Bacillota bacterium]
MAFSRDFLEEIKQRNSIEDVVSQYVPLKRAGSNMTGLCPFHNEKTPSFVVFPRSESFYCFGCGEGGDVVSFIMKHESLEYPDAVALLAKRCGIQVPDDAPMKSNAVRRERIIAMNRDAAMFFHTTLYSPAGEKGLEYFKSRRLSDATIKHFGLGYAGDSWNALSDYLHEKGYSDREMTTGFLAGEKGKRVYDYFRSRVMFPIIDLSGNVVAFGGRALGDAKPKYINSSDTPAFRKSKYLFALNFAKLNTSGGLIMCEGYMDVISLHQAGFTNAVATLGTAVNAEHAKTISHHTDSVMLAYDSDSAGKKATERAINVLGEAGINVRVIDLGDSKDPDEFIKNHGTAAFSAKLKTTKERIDYQIEEIIGKYDVSGPDQQEKRMTELTAFVATLYSQPTREIYCHRIAQLTGLSYEGLARTVEVKRRALVKTKKSENDAIDIRRAAGYRDNVNPDRVRFSDVSAIEEAIIGILLVRPDLGTECLKKLKADELNTEFCRKVYRAFEPQLAKGESVILSEDGALTNAEQSELARYMAARQILTNNGSSVLTELINTLKEKNERRKADESAGDDIDALGDYLKKLREKKK